MFIMVNHVHNSGFKVFNSAIIWKTAPLTTTRTGVVIPIYLGKFHHDLTVLPHWNHGKGKYPQIALIQVSEIL